MQKIGRVVGVLVVGAGLLFAAVWLLLDVNRYRGAIQTRLVQQLGRKVTLGKMTLGLFPLRFQAEDSIIAEAPGFPDAFPFISAKRLDVRVSLISMFSGDIKINSLELQRPTVELTKNKQGVWNFSSLGTGGVGGTNALSEAPAAGTAAPAVSETGPAAARDFTLDKVVVRDGQIAYADLQQSEERAIYDHIDLTLLDYAAGKPFSIDLSAHIQGQGAQEFRLKGEGGPVSANLVDTPFSGALSLGKVGIDGLKKFFNSKDLSKVEGALSGESRISNQSGILAAAGTLKLEGTRINDLDIGYPITLDYDLGGKLSEGLLTIKSAKVGLGQTPLALSGTVDTNATPVSIDLNVKTGDVSIAEIARLASAFGVAFAPDTKVDGRVSADVRVKGSAGSPVLTGSIAGRALRIASKDIPQPVEVKSLDLALSPTEIRSNEFDATTGKTTVSARFAIAQYMSKSPLVDLGVRSPGATLPEIQSMARAYGITGLDQIDGQGTLNLDLRAAGALQSLSTAGIVRALNGAINLDFSPLRIKGFDAASQLASIAGFKSDSATPGVTELLRLNGRILVKNGVAQSDDLRAQLPIGNLSAAGTANLSEELLNLRVTAVLAKAFSDRMAATRTGSFLNATLANSAGEVVIPALVTGNFRQPQFAPDLKAYAQIQKQRLLPTFDNPAAALSRALGALTGSGKAAESPEQTPEQKDAKPQKPADKVRGILDDLFGTKKP